MLAVKIAALGTYLPPRRIGNAELERQLQLAEGWIERATGVRERRRAVAETSAGMAAVAARVALDRAGLDPTAIDLVVGASTAPQQLIPCTAALVQRELGLPDGGSACFDVNATCLSFLFALHAAAHLVAAGAHRRALIFSSEIVHRTLDSAEPESSVLLGDAAAAAVIEPCPAGEASAIWQARFVTHSSGADLTECPGGGTLHHPDDPATTPRMNQFHMNGPAVFRMAARLLGPFVDDFFTAPGWDRRDVVVVPHQASGRGVQLLVSRCGFRPEQLVLNLAERGNCVAASIPLALAEAVDAGRIRRGQRVFLVGTGAGLTLGAIGLTF